jgi:hypothetical protein
MLIRLIIGVSTPVAGRFEDFEPVDVLLVFVVEVFVELCVVVVVLVFVLVFGA